MRRFGSPYGSYTSGPSQRKGEGGRVEAYGEFTAAELYCPHCKAAMPVRERLLLVLPDGELYEYLCVQCGRSVGEKRAMGKENIQIVVA